MSTIYKGMADFMVIQVICVVLVLAFPGIAMWFPNWLLEGDRMATPALPADPAADDANRLEKGDGMTREEEAEPADLEKK